MTIQDIITLICGVGWVGTLIMFFIQRHDSKKQANNEIAQRLDAIEKQQAKGEKDSVRIQLLLLMTAYTDEDEHELLTVAEHYFSDLKANWFMTAKFNRFLKAKNIATPEWFKE